MTTRYCVVCHRRPVDPRYGEWWCCAGHRADGISPNGARRRLGLLGKHEDEEEKDKEEAKR